MTPGDQPDSYRKVKTPNQRSVRSCRTVRSAAAPPAASPSVKNSMPSMAPARSAPEITVVWSRSTAPGSISRLDTRRGRVTQLGSRKTPPRAIRDVQALLFYIVLGVSSVMLGSVRPVAIQRPPDSRRSRRTRADPDDDHSLNRWAISRRAAGVTLCGITREETTSWRCSR